jgi:transcriptional regulator with XRE-family HTH domain
MENQLPVQKLRLKRGWSQQQLADASGLSVRTVQRIESGMPASTETLKSLAAVFEVDFSTLNPEETVNSAEQTLETKQEAQAFRHVRRLRHFYVHLFQFVPVSILLVLVNLWVSPRHLWSVWVTAFMALGIAIHAVYVFGNARLLGPQWELREVEKRLGRPL